MGAYFPATIVENVNDIGQKSYAIRYANGSIVHKGFRFYEGAEIMLKRLEAIATRQFKV